MKEMRRLIFGGIVSLVMALLLIPGHAFADENVCPVSYTPLDVYKRQTSGWIISMLWNS